MAEKKNKIVLPSYFKNVSQSLKYISRDTLDELIPAIKEYKTANEDLQYVPPKTIIKNFINKIKKSTDMSFVNKGFDNLKSDLKSGKFYNKDRMDKAAKEELKDFGFDDDFGDDNDNDGSFSDDFGFDDDSPKSSRKKSSARKVSQNIFVGLGSGKVIESANIIGKTIIGSSRLAVETQQKLFGFMELKSQKRHVATISTLNVMNSNLSSIVTGINRISEFASSAMEYQDRSLGYQEDTMNLIREMNEMQQTQMRKEATRDEDYDDDIISSSGAINLKRYKKEIKKNFFPALDEALPPLGTIMELASLGKDMGGGFAKSMFSKWINSPVAAIISTGIGVALGPVITKGLENISKSLLNFGSSLLLKMRNGFGDALFGEHSVMGSIFNGIGRLLGIEGKQTGSAHPKLEKKPTPFDTYTRKAIIHVIPTLLSKIYSAISGNPELIVDYEKGARLITKKSTYNDYKSEISNASRYGYSDGRQEMNARLKKSGLTSKQQSAVSGNIDALFRYMTEYGIIFNPNNSKHVNALAKYGNMTPAMAKTIATLYSTTSEDTRIGIGTEILSAKNNLGSSIRRIEKEAEDSRYGQLLMDIKYPDSERTKKSKEFKSNKERDKALKILNMSGKMKLNFSSLAEKKAYMKKISEKDYDNIKDEFLDDEFSSYNWEDDSINSKLKFGKEKTSKVKGERAYKITDKQFETINRKLLKEKKLTKKEIEDYSDTLGKKGNEMVKVGKGLIGMITTPLSKLFSGVRGGLENLTTATSTIIHDVMMELLYGQNKKHKVIKKDANGNDVEVEEEMSVMHAIFTTVRKTFNEYLRKPFTEKVWNPLKKSVIDPLKKKIMDPKGFLDQAKDFFSEIIDRVIGKKDKDNIRSGGLIKKAKTKIFELLEKPIGWVKDISNSLVNNILGVKDAETGKRTGGMLDNLRKGVSGIFKTGKAFGKDLIIATADRIFGSKDEKTGKRRSDGLFNFGKIKNQFNSGLNSIKDLFVGTGSFSEKKKVFLDKAKLFFSGKQFVFAAGLGILGSIFLPGGPILGGIIGTLAGLGTNLKSLKEGLIGKGNKLSEVIQNAKDKLKGADFYRSISGMGLGGLLGSFFLPGGPLLGSVVGAAVGGFVSLASQATKLRTYLFGSKIADIGLLSKRTQSLFKRFAPTGALSFSMGMAGTSMGGPLVGLFGFAAGAILSETQTFKRFLWGTKDKLGNKMRMGIFEKLGLHAQTYILLPFRKQFTTLFENIRHNMFKNVLLPLKGFTRMLGLQIRSRIAGVFDWFKKSRIGSFIIGGFSRIFNRFEKITSWIGNKIFGIANKIFGKYNPLRLVGWLLRKGTDKVSKGLRPEYAEEAARIKRETTGAEYAEDEKHKKNKGTLGEIYENLDINIKRNSELLEQDIKARKEDTRRLKEVSNNAYKPADELKGEYDSAIDEVNRSKKEEISKLGFFPDRVKKERIERKYAKRLSKLHSKYKPELDKAFSSARENELSGIKDVLGEADTPTILEARKTSEATIDLNTKADKTNDLLERILITLNNKPSDDNLDNSSKGRGMNMFKGFIPSSAGNGIGSILGGAAKFLGRKAWTGAKGAAKWGIRKVKNFLSSTTLGKFAKKTMGAIRTVKGFFNEDTDRGKSAQEMLRVNPQEMIYNKLSEIAQHTSTLLEFLPQISGYGEVSARKVSEVADNTDELEGISEQIENKTGTGGGNSLGSVAGDMAASGVLGKIGGIGGIGRALMTGAGTLAGGLSAPVIATIAALLGTAYVGKKAYDKYQDNKAHNIEIGSEAAREETLEAYSNKMALRRGGKLGSAGTGPLSQMDPTIAGMKYAASGENTTIGDAGCSPVSMANAFNNMGSNANPLDVIGESSKYKVKGSGTNHFGLKQVANKFGYNMKSSTSNLTSNIDDSLNRGGQALVVGSGKEGLTPFTDAGHTVDIAGKVGNDYLISNPLHQGYEVWNKDIINQTGQKAMALNPKSSGMGAGDKAVHSKFNSPNSKTVSKNGIISQILSLFSTGSGVSKSSISGLHQILLARLLSYGKLFWDKYKRKPMLTSAYRTGSEQRRLTGIKGGAAAKPGRSKHEYGLAVDISRSTIDADLLRQSGLDRPLLNWKYPEPWHIEPFEWSRQGLDGSKQIASKFGNITPPIPSSGGMDFAVGSVNNMSVDPSTGMPNQFNPDSIANSYGISSSNPMFSFIKNSLSTVFDTISGFFNEFRGSSSDTVPSTGYSDDGINKAGSPATGDRRAFIEKLTPGAIRGYKEGKILPSLTIAQGILESGWGSKSIGNNIFGIKAGSGWKGKKRSVATHEESNGRRFATNAMFRDYDSIDDAILDHTRVLQNPRYQKVGLQESKTFNEATARVKAGGYATDSKYPSLLNNIITSRNIHKIDEEVLKGNYNVTYGKALGLNDSSGTGRMITPEMLSRAKDIDMNNIGSNSNTHSASIGSGDTKIVQLLEIMVELTKKIADKDLTVNMPDKFKVDMPPSAFGITSADLAQKGKEVANKMNSTMSNIGGTGIDPKRLQDLYAIATGR